MRSASQYNSAICSSNTCHSSLVDFMEFILFLFHHSGAAGCGFLASHFTIFRSSTQIA